jgi:hypothetical protein
MEYVDETIGFQAQPMEEDTEPQIQSLTYDMVSNSAGGYSYAVNEQEFVIVESITSLLTLLF